MSDSRRHPRVVNLDELSPRSFGRGEKFSAQGRALGRATGSRSIGCSWFEVPPGRAAFPHHYHCVNEEALFVLEGRGTLRIGDDAVELRAGDYVTFALGPEHAHQLRNTGDTPLRYLCLSTLVNADVVGYPDSKKIGALATAPGTQESWVRFIARESSHVDYFDGEDVD